MPAKTQYQNGLLYEQAAGFAQALETSQTAATDQMLAAWTDSYWGIRQEMDQFLVKVATAKAAGAPMSPAWAFQQQRMKNLLDTTKVQIARYAADASMVTEKAQWAAIQASLKHAESLAGTAVKANLPGIGVDLATVNPKNLEHLVGFMSDGSVLRNHLALTLPAKTATKVQEALIHGIATGKSQDWMVRKATEALGVAHSRAVTIMRTESLRAYRAASRATYMANSDVLGTWVWNAHLDSRTCLACALMDGTEHPLDATLDGHPRCRCAMVPRTRSWEDLGVEGLPDTRPPIRSGKAWLESQTPAVQKALMGPGKFQAWTEGLISLDDMVARSYSPAWGTMRTERSLVAIAEGRNANWVDAAVPIQPLVKVAKPQPHLVQEFADRYDLDYLNEWATTPGNSPQALANVQAAINLKVTKLGRQGPKMPTPDAEKVATAVAKLEQAVLTKGYPSKGYSQTKAIYKAQANGTPGTQVGVVKSLTLEQKITAQAILDEHDAALPILARKAEKAKALENAYDEALAIQAQKLADEAATAYTAKVHDAVMAAKGHDGADLAFSLRALDLDDALQAAGDDAVKVAVVKAQQTALAAYREAYDQARESVLGNGWGGTTWTHAASDLQIDVADDGWGVLHLPNSPQAKGIPLPPQSLYGSLTDPKAQMTQHLEPDLDNVKAWQNAWSDEDGYVIPDTYNDAKVAVDDPFTTPQDKVDLQAALDLDWAAGKWKPEPQYVAKIKADLDAGSLDVPTLQAIVKDGKPLSQANATEAIAQHQAEMVAKASIPVPKPAIDPAKIKWDLASDTQVGKLIAGVEQGKSTVDDLYVKFQAAKNSGPKANYAKAILTLEGKADAIPKPLPTLDAGQQYLVNLWESDLKAGNTTLDDLAATSHYLPESDQVALKYLLDKYDDAPTAPFKAPVTSPPTPTPNAPVWPTKPPWEPSALKDTGKVLGTHGARVYEAPDGTRWLFKPPKDRKDGFLATLDEAASRFQAMAGLRAPDTYVVTLGGKRGSIQRMFPSSEGFPGGFSPASLAKADLDAVSREHVLDWFLSNHDGHRDQFLRLNDGTMVGVDKGQAFRWFGQDRLDWDFHPNGSYGTPEPVYNALWRDFAAGKDVDLDPPGTGAMWDQVKAIQAISDDDLRRMFRPYAEEAAAQGKLALPQPGFPGVTKATIQANDVDAFLDALVKRKNGLDDDFRALYDKAAKARSKALPGWTPKAATPKVTGAKAKWVGKDKPPTPTPPTEPMAETATLFDTWLDDAKARYAAFAPGKTLEASNNWARFRRVVDDLDLAAVKELQDRNYLDDATAAQARALIQEAKAKRADLEGAYKRALADHDKAIQAYKKDLTDWKDANGVKDLTQGMEDAALRHDTDAKGVAWAKKHFSSDRYTATQRRWLKSYTGSGYSSWNRHLRDTKGAPTQYADTFKAIDKAMEAQPIPEDVILHRGTSLDAFKIDGRTVGYGTDMSRLIGSVQVDHAYMSTSVGNSAAFSSMPVQLKIRAPAGTPGSYVQMFSNYEHERELILARGTHMYVHNAYKRGDTWYLEVEIVPDDFDPANATPSPSTKPWSK